MNQVLIDALVKFGGPMLAKVIGRQFGAGLGELTQEAIDTLAQALGVEPTEEAVTKGITEAPANKARPAVVAAEANMAQILAAYAETQRQGNEQQRMTNELLQAQMKVPGWRSDWLYVWQWFLMFSWLWTIILVPVMNAALRLVAPGSLVDGTAAPPAIWAPDLGVLLTLTGLYLGLHMGGHTVLELVRGQWGGLFGKGASGAGKSGDV